MPHLYLLRHGIAATDGDDPPLSHEGILRMEAAAGGMRRMGLSFGLILTSPLRRARETARIVADRLAAEETLRICPEAGPGCVLPILVRLIMLETADGNDVDSILVVGHQPDMGKLAKDLSCADAPISFGRGTLACFETPAWPPAPPCGMVFVMPAEELEKRGVTS